MGFDTVTRSLFFARNTVGIPVIGPAVPERNPLGGAGSTVMLRLSLDPPGVLRTSDAFPSTWNGSCALIWVGDANTIGVTMPFTVRQDSPNVVGSGVPVAERIIGLRFL